MENVTEELKKCSAITTKWAQTQSLFKQQLASIDSQITEMSEGIIHLEAAEQVLADTIAHCSAETKSNIEAFLSLSLQQIFQNPGISIELLQEVKRDRVETQIILHDGEAAGPPSKTAGGGVQNVIGFLLRFLALRRLNLQPIMVLDEAFRNVSANHLPALCSFLKHLTQDHSLDILLVTHEIIFMNIASSLYKVVKTPTEGLKVVEHTAQPVI